VSFVPPRPRAAGVLIEFERGRPIIVDRPLYRELVKGAIKRTHAELEAKAAAAAKEEKDKRVSKQPADPVKVAKRERDAQLRELTDQAHGANLDLGVSLMHNLAAVEPDDIEVARFFVLCGCPHKTNYADRLTMRIRLCRQRGTATRLVVASPKARIGRARGEEDDGLHAPRRSRVHAGAVLLTLADLGRAKVPRLSGRDGGCDVVATLAMADEAARSSTA
jgi:hypothetical protein